MDIPRTNYEKTPYFYTAILCKINERLLNVLISTKKRLKKIARYGKIYEKPFIFP